jgi:hypothetical protein
LQHGAISPFHLGYSYPGRPVVADQPDELWCFGSYWTEVADLPAGMVTAVAGAPFIEPLPDAGRAAKEPQRVVFLSQGTIGPRLFEFAAWLADARPEYEVVFRLHPSEHAADYSARSGVRISAGQGESTLALLASAGYQVGVATTALFEGMVLGCRTAVAQLPGHEYLLPVVNRGDAVLADSPAALADLLPSAPVCSDSSSYYAPDNLAALLKA